MILCWGWLALPNPQVRLEIEANINHVDSFCGHCKQSKKTDFKGLSAAFTHCQCPEPGLKTLPGTRAHGLSAFETDPGLTICRPQQLPTSLGTFDAPDTIACLGIGDHVV